MSSNNLPPLVVFHYDFSPWGRKLRAYLALRGIPYLSCQQPVTMPRPDLEALDIKYRRIPLLFVGKDVYCDTGLAVNKLGELFPASPTHPDVQAGNSPEAKALDQMLATWIEAVVWKYAVYAVPTSLDAVFANQNFLDDRTSLFGREWSKENQDKLKIESDHVLRQNFEFLETTLLSDGRKWLLGDNSSNPHSSGPSLADIQVGFLFDWLRDLGGSWPSDMNEDSGNYPKFWAWLNRYRDAVNTRKEKSGEIKELSSQEAIDLILSSGHAGIATQSLQVDTGDSASTGLKKGDHVQGYPKDYGYTHKDVGELVGLTREESVIQNTKGIRIHHPRWPFVVEKADGQVNSNQK